MTNNTSGAPVTARNEGQGLPICEKLRATKTEHKIQMLFGGAVGIDGEETRDVPINPDGPEAAAVIEVAIGALQRIAAIPITDIYARPEQPCVIARAALAKVQVPHD